MDAMIGFLLDSLWEHKAVKGVLSLFFTYVSDTFIEIGDFAIVMIALVFCDLITGIGASHTRKYGEDKLPKLIISSDGMRKTLVKSVFYFIAILVCKEFQGVFLGKAFPLTHTISAYICLTELRSVLSNISVITGTDLTKIFKILDIASAFTKKK